MSSHEFREPARRPDDRTQHAERAVDTLGMPPTPLEHVLFLQALASLVARREIVFRGDIAELAEQMLRAFRPRARA